MQWFIIFHLFGAIFWIGGLLVLSSILAIAAADESAAGQASLLTVSRRLFNSVCNAGAVITIIFGILIIVADPQVMQHGWMHVKLTLVVVLLALHGWMYARGKRIGAIGGPTRHEFQLLHGLVSVVLLAILVMVIRQPF